MKLAITEIAAISRQPELQPDSQPDSQPDWYPLVYVGPSREVTGEVTGEVSRLLEVMAGEMKRTEIQQALGLKHEDHFRDAYLLPALALGVIEMTYPDKPRSSKQRYRRLTQQGKALRDEVGE